MSLATPRKGYKSVPWLFGKEIEIPEEWEMKRLDEVGEIVGGGTPDSTNNDYWDGKILWAVPTDITKLQINQIENTERKITQQGLDNSSAKMLPEKSILITSRATVGECAITTKPISTNQGFQNIICNDKHHNYLIFYLVKQFPNNLLRLSHGTTFLEISKNQIKKVAFPVSNSFQEQQKIATILSNIDNLIESTVQVITNSKKVKTGLMQKLLTRGISHTKFKKVPWLFGKEIEIPEEWEVRKLDSLVTLLTNGFVGKAKEHYTESENGVLYIQGYNIEENNFKFHGIKYVTPQFHKQQQKSNLQLGDLLTVQTGNVGTTAIISKSLVGANCHALIISRFKKEIADSDYFCQYFNSRLCQKSFKSIEIGTSLKHLNGSDMKRLQFVLPPLPEQQKIASILSNIDDKITSQEKYKEKLEKLKKSLMQKLLTGEVRV